MPTFIYAPDRRKLTMIRIFIFECEKCGYSVRATGGLTEGLDLSTENAPAAAFLLSAARSQSASGIEGWMRRRLVAFELTG